MTKGQVPGVQVQYLSHITKVERVNVKKMVVAAMLPKTYKKLGQRRGRTERRGEEGERDDD